MTAARLLAEVFHRVPLGAPSGTRWKSTSLVATAGGKCNIAVAARIDNLGRRREQFWFDGARVELPVFLRLSCAEWECPHAMHVRAQWNAFRRRETASARAPSATPQPLMAEIPITVGQQRFVARPARFACYTRCPNGAHPPMTIDKTGFDLFDDVGCLGGGVVESQGVRRPRIPTVSAAEAYALARYLESMAAVGIARHRSRGRPDPASTDD